MNITGMVIYILLSYVGMLFVLKVIGVPKDSVSKPDTLITGIVFGLSPILFPAALMIGGIMFLGKNIAKLIEDNEDHKNAS
jgi:hypothetical protein